MTQFLETEPGTITNALAAAQMRHFRISEAQQIRAWETSQAALRQALRLQPDASSWWLFLEYPMLRLGRRADAILVMPHVIAVLEFKIGAQAYRAADRIQVEDYAIDLHDFHAASRSVPVVPVLVATDAPPPATAQRPLPTSGVTRVMETNAALLGALLSEFAIMPCAGVPIDPTKWGHAPYRPVPMIVEAACMLYAGHGVAEIKAARADAQNLSMTTSAILATIRAARQSAQRCILFVTGIPGAGKTLCGLNASFGGQEEARATFLTGNPSLVHVLREALARDAIAAGADCRAARQKMESAIQALPRFRDHHVERPAETPAERIVVVDEAQRCWSAIHARNKTRDRPVRLTQSEPHHLLEIMGRHKGFSAMICLVGGGQEIHDGEGGLAEWGEALRSLGGWQVLAAPTAVHNDDGRQRLGEIEGMACLPALHLETPMRQIRFPGAAAWADAVLRGAETEAMAIAGSAEGALPFRLTRSLSAMRQWLRKVARGRRRAGLLASSGARRLRAEGLGVELPHMDASSVARWFLDYFPPDVRASNSLEVVATEFSCQGLEIDYAGLCWDGDLVRGPVPHGWRARAFRGCRWIKVEKAESISNQLNTYRVLLTRARYETVIFVPKGAIEDATRTPQIYDEIANYLTACGARQLQACDLEALPAAADLPNQVCLL